ncbi:MAG: MFS transporter, partial [Gammaproteobacteria bacterium]
MNIQPAAAEGNIKSSSIYLGVIISALGYFVDIYDLTLFSIVRVESLIDLGFSGSALQEQGIYILNMQMLGMLIGGILWGILGDKRGRISVLFGSILLYSVANILNGYVQDVDSYAWIRFFAGIGLAGELGVGITLVSESLPQKYRGYGTLLVAASGALGAVAGFYVADLTNWRIAYFIGGGMGLVLLLLRFQLVDSPLFIKMRAATHTAGNFLMLFQSKELFMRYLKCILLGVPLWVIVGIVASFSPEIATSMQITDPISAGRCIMLCNAGIALGDIGSGLLSQLLKSRKKALACFIIFTIITSIILLNGSGYSAYTYYWGIFFLGFGTGMWALTITTAAEQFGTDIRATVTTTVPNFVRGMLIPLTIVFQALQAYFAIQYAALLITCTILLLALIALFSLAETFSRN